LSKKKKAAEAKQPVINESYELVATDRLTPHPRNVNRGDMVAIGGSIAENGFYGAVVAQKSTGHILAGNHRYDSAVAAGIAAVPVTWVDVDDDRALRILLADNRTTRLGHDDQEALVALLQEILDDTQTLAGTGFDEAALDELLAEVGITECAPEGLTDEDTVPEPLAFPVTEPGDLWVLGNHRLLCGDSTSIDAVQRLMDGDRADICITSPPYNAGSLEIEGNKSTQKKYNNCSDAWTEDQYRDFLVQNINCILSCCDDAFYNIGLVEKNKRVIVDVLSHYRSEFKDIIYWNKSTVAPHIQPGVINNKVEFISQGTADGVGPEVLRRDRSPVAGLHRQGSGTGV
jgi:hypothetical protein